jgi:hypothetical protein
VYRVGIYRGVTLVYIPVTHLVIDIDRHTTATGVAPFTPASQQDYYCRVAAPKLPRRAQIQWSYPIVQGFPQVLLRARIVMRRAPQVLHHGVDAAEDRQVLRPEGRLHGIDAFDRPLLVVRHFYRPRELERRSKKISAYSFDFGGVRRQHLHA